MEGDPQVLRAKRVVLIALLAVMVVSLVMVYLVVLPPLFVILFVLSGSVAIGVARKRPSRSDQGASDEGQGQDPP
jgi:hypothetical protein